MDSSMVAIEFAPDVKPQSVGVDPPGGDSLCASIPQLLSDLAVAFERLQAENVRLRAMQATVVAPGEASAENQEEAAGACQLNGCATSRSSGNMVQPHDASTVGLADPAALAKVKKRVTNPRVVLQSLPAVAPPALPTAPPAVAPTPNDGVQPSDSEGAGPKASDNEGAVHLHLSHHRRTDSTNALRAEDAVETDQGLIREQWDPFMEPDLVKAAFVRHGRASTHSSQVSRTGDVLRSSSRLQKFTVHPSSRLVVWWDVLSILLLTCDVLTTPLAAFGVYVHEEYPWIVTIGATFWTTDIVFQACQGYYVNSMVEMRPTKILRRYLRSTAVIDVGIVITDWLYIFAGSSTHLAGFLRLQKGARVFRLARIFRLLRLVKLVIMLYSIGMADSTRNVMAFFRIARNVLYIVFFNHFVACSWYAISLLSRDYGYKTWIEELPSELPSPTPGQPGSTFYEYTTALHWALTQFTPASMEVHPENPIERLFTVCMMLCSLLGFSSVVASMTAIMTQTMAENAEHIKRTELLKRFIADHRVSVDLSSRIQTYMGNQRRRLDAHTMLESRVPALQTLPQNLRQDLHAEVTMNVLVEHPLFAELSRCDAAGMLHTTAHAMTDEVFLVGSHVWADDERAERMLFVLRGDFHLFPSGASSVQWQSDELEPHATDGDMLSEVALWLQWTYSGTLYSISDAEMFALSAAEFARIMHGGPALRLLFAYARRFQIYARDDGISTICDVSDMRLMVVQAKMDTGQHVDLWAHGFVRSCTHNFIKRAVEPRPHVLKRAFARAANFLAGAH